MSTAPESEYYDYRPQSGHTGPSPASPQRRHPGPGYDNGYDPRYHSYDERYDRRPPPRDPPTGQQQQPPHFDPPPRDPGDYPPQDYRDPRASYDQSYQQSPQPTEYGPPPGANRNPPSDRPYAPSEPRPSEGNQLAPYDEEKAEAEWRGGYSEQQQAYGYGRPPGSDYERRPQYDDGDRFYNDRDRYDPRYDDSRRDDRYARDREHDRQRRRDSPPVDDRLTRHQSQSKKRGGKDYFGGSEGERGLGATLAGAGGGALLGHEFGDGALGTLGGAVAGALVAKVAENFVEKRKAEKELRRREPPYDKGNHRDLRDAPPIGGGYIEDRGYPSDERYPPRDARGGRGDYGRDEFARNSREDYDRSEYTRDSQRRDLQREDLGRDSRAGDFRRSDFARDRGGYDRDEYTPGTRGDREDVREPSRTGWSGDDRR